MTALEAYALAKKIAKSAVSGIKSLTVNGTTLTIETNDGNTIDMVFPVPADGRGIASAEIDSNGHLILTYDDGDIQDAGVVPGADVEVTPIVESGVKIAEIKVNDKTTSIFIPDDVIPDLSGIIADKFDITKDYAVGDEVIYEDDNLLYKFIAPHAAGAWDPSEVVETTVTDLINGKQIDYEDVANKPAINGVTLDGDKTLDDIGMSPLTNEQLTDLFNLI